MTAEIAILNKEAVAMAADSAATMSSATGQKVLSSANKVFALSKHHPVGIMIYGSALFMGIPWETLIKAYRKKLGSTSFDTLHEYGSGFIEYLKSSVTLFPKSEQEEYVVNTVYSFFTHIRKVINEIVKDEIHAKKKISEKEITKICDIVIADNLAKWKNGECNIANKIAHHRQIKATYRKVVSKIQDQVFEKLPLSSRSTKMLLEIAGYLFICFPENLSNPGSSGIVISGFGEEELFPSLLSYAVEGMASNVLKYKEQIYHKIDFDNSALVMPFAQQEMVATFIEGISPRYNRLYDDMLRETVEKYPEIIIDNISPKLSPVKRNQLIKKIRKVGIDNLKKGLEDIERVKQNRYINPILSVVTFLSKRELAEMAESLVNLTCLRKKISMDDETVGGLIDVAVISKGDGLIWIKRKHYFQQDMNKHFFINYLEK